MKLFIIDLFHILTNKSVSLCHLQYINSQKKNISNINHHFFLMNLHHHLIPLFFHQENLILFITNISSSLYLEHYLSHISRILISHYVLLVFFVLKWILKFNVRPPHRELLSNRDISLPLHSSLISLLVSAPQFFH